MDELGEVGWHGMIDGWMGLLLRAERIHSWNLYIRAMSGGSGAQRCPECPAMLVTGMMVKREGQYERA